MTLNLNKHGAAMQAAWKEVLDPNNPINWALFGYEGNSFDLKLVSKGQDGVEEMVEDLNANKIMYAFCQIDDPKTSLPKFVLLNWQGESVLGTRKGICTTHLKDVAAYFHGAHLTINARDEDEVNLEDIQAKVAKASASTYNFKDRPTGAMEEAPAPVGSSHQRIIPEKELPKLSERERFWNEEQSREKARIAAEKERRVEENAKLEEERRRREEEETKRREADISEKERKVSALKDADKAREEEKDKQKWAHQQEEDRQAEMKRQQRSEEMRRERNEEAKQLISQRSGDAKSVFERNSSAGQFNFRRQSNTSAPKVEEVPPPEPSPPPPPLEAAEEILPPPAIFMGQQENGQPTSTPDVASEAAVRPDIIQDINNDPAPDVTNGDTNGADLGLCAVAIYDYQAADDTEISFDPDQLITNIEKIDPGWWQGLGPNGNFGLFPANYVECIDAERAKMLRNPMTV